MFTIVVSSFPLIDKQADGSYQKLFQRALVTFALARTLNGVISVVQGTELAIQPAGVGLTLTPGEILDPVNDLVERFSWIMLGATVSLGVQQVLMEVSAWWVMKLLVAILGAWGVFILLAGRGLAGKQGLVVTRLLAIVVFLRFAVPVALLVNDALYDLFLEERFMESTALVTSAGEEIRQIGEPVESHTESDSGLFGSIGQAVDQTRQAFNLSEKVLLIKERASEIIEHLIGLSVVFILQTGILPLVFLWLFIRMGAFVLGPRFTQLVVKNY